MAREDFCNLVPYPGNFIFVVSLGVISRTGLVDLPPINTLTDIANNAMEAEIAAGSLNPYLATGWATNFWVGLLQQYFAQDEPGGFVARYCAEHASLCTGIVY